MENKILRAPIGLTQPPYHQIMLQLNGFSAIESCTFTEGKKGSMLLDDHLLLLVLHGVYTVRHGNHVYTVRKNEMVLLQKAIVIEYDKHGEPDNRDMLEYMMFFLKDDLLKEFIKMANIKPQPREQPVPVYVKKIDERLLLYADSLRPYFSEPDKIDNGLIRIKLLELLFDLAHADSNLLQQLFQLKQPRQTSISKVVEDNLWTPLSLNDLAYLSGRSLSSFKRDFQAIYNMPPSLWIREKRLEKAKELLTVTSMSITDVCYTTGFENVAHFSRIFKDHFGHPPSALRQSGSLQQA